GQGEELADSRGTHHLQGLEQPLHNGTEQFIRLEVERRPRQPRELAVEEQCTELMQPTDSPVQQGSNDRLGRRLSPQGVQVALHDGSGVLFEHCHIPSGWKCNSPRLMSTLHAY